MPPYDRLPAEKDTTLSNKEVLLRPLLLVAFPVLTLIWLVGTPFFFYVAIVSTVFSRGEELSAYQEANLTAFGMCACLPPLGCLWIAVRERWRRMTWLTGMAVPVGICVTVGGVVMVRG